MNKLILIFAILVNTLAACPQTSGTREKDDIKGKVRQAYAEALINKYVLDEYFDTVKTEFNGDELTISLYIGEKGIANWTKDSSKFSAFMDAAKGTAVKRIEDMGADPAPYDKTDWGADIYAIENPIWGMQKGRFSYVVGTNPNFDNFNTAHIIYYSPDGIARHRQTIDKAQKEIVRQLAKMNLSSNDIISLASQKEGVDAGVIKNKQMIPYQLDPFTTMEDIELNGNSYIYYLSVPGNLMNLMEVNDFYGLNTELKNQLDSLTVPMKYFFNAPGAEKFGIEMIYLYRDSQTKEPFIKYVYNPCTKDCKMVPLAKNIIEKFKSEL